MIQLTHQLRKSEKFVLHYLTDMQKFVGVHPFLERVELLGGNNYRVFEKQTLLGVLPFHFSYPIILENSISNKSVTITAEVFTLVKIKMIFLLSESEGVTTVKETIDFNSLFPVSFLLESLFRKSHTRLFQNIEKKER